MGNRPQQLEVAIASTRAQLVDVEVVLVVNGGNPDRSLADVVVEPGENVGIPEGRNRGVRACTSELVCFVDDDAALVGDVLTAVREAFAADSRLAAIGLRITDEEGNTARRYVPGLRKDPNRSRAATSFPGGACVVRRTAFESVGGFCGAFRYGLEETDLAWRLIDAGWDVQYRADLELFHPNTRPERHRDFAFLTARNRMWLARRLLPWVLAVAYVGNWTIITIIRNLRRPALIAAHLQGTAAGVRSVPEQRRVIRWRTVCELVRRGRPPVI